MQSGVPIKPSDIPAAKAAVIPAFVIDAFNECIAKNYANGRAHFLQKDVQTIIQDKCTEKGIWYKMHFLDIEPIYEKNGWKVEYDKPAYCESYDASFTFIKRQSFVDDGPKDSK